MTEQTDATPAAPAPGTIAWFDLTVPNADEVRDFYAAVVGWEHDPVAMGDYADWSMRAPDGPTVAGICHARGENAGMPAQWMAYVAVTDLDATMARCRDLGGEVIAGPRGEAPGPRGEAPGPRFSVIRDPAGAHLALMEMGGA
jgi:hypothetical protein